MPNDKFLISGSNSWGNASDNIWSATSGGGGDGLGIASDDNAIMNENSGEILINGVVACGTLDRTLHTNALRIVGGFSIDINGDAITGSIESLPASDTTFTAGGSLTLLVGSTFPSALNFVLDGVGTHIFTSNDCSILGDITVNNAGVASLTANDRMNLIKLIMTAGELVFNNLQHKITTITGGGGALNLGSCALELDGTFTGTGITVTATDGAVHIVNPVGGVGTIQNVTIADSNIVYAHDCTNGGTNTGVVFDGAYWNLKATAMVA